MDNLPLVSVPVCTYNSSKTVLETLDSIKAQTYQNIELIVSDDCSTDNTVQLCKDWIAANKDRFVRTVMLESPVNTGNSTNGNRAREACEGEWIKGIAGDDLLLSDCVETCVNYVSDKDDVIILFGKIIVFGEDKNNCERVERFFDYSFFNLPADQQLHQLIFQGNCIPAITSFYNRSKYSNLGVVNDERIPLLEDWAKWINLLRKGVHFYFVDSYLAKYRVGGISTSGMTLPYYKSVRLMFFYYQYPELLKENPVMAINGVVESECALYVENTELRRQLNKIHSSFPYKCYIKLLYPIVSLIRSSRKSH